LAPLLAGHRYLAVRRVTVMKVASRPRNKIAWAMSWEVLEVYRALLDVIRVEKLSAKSRQRELRGRPEHLAGL
jgi:hypothetical protein